MLAGEEVTAIQARFVDYRTIKTKSVFHLIFEVQIEQADAALACLGGTPQPGRERWVGIAPLRSAVDRLLQAEEGGALPAANPAPATADEEES